MYQRILVPTDGSVGSAHVALQAIDLAERYGATVHVLHVIDEGVSALVDGLEGGDSELESRGQRAVERVERMADAHGVDVVTRVERGDPVEGILTYAEKHDVDAIVAGTHGRTGLARRIIGSVAEGVVRQAPCPVMTVRLPETDVTVEDAETAIDIATAALDREDVDVVSASAERQVSVWVVDIEGSETSWVIYVDPVTQRTSVIERD